MQGCTMRKMVRKSHLAEMTVQSRVTPSLRTYSGLGVMHDCTVILVNQLLVLVIFCMEHPYIVIHFIYNFYTCDIAAYYQGV